MYNKKQKEILDIMKIKQYLTLNPKKYQKYKLIRILSPIFTNLINITHNKLRSANLI